MTQAVLIYPHQLFQDHPLINSDTVVIMIEEPLMFTQYRFHKQKLILHRASMKAYRDNLITSGHEVIYIEYCELLDKSIGQLLAQRSITEVSLCDVTDNWIDKRLRASLENVGISYSIVDTPMFITSKADMDGFFLPIIGAGKRLNMGNFYQWQRKRLKILIDKEGKPIGGQWSHDQDNRKKIPKNLKLPSDPTPTACQYVLEAKEYIQENFPNNYGETESFFYPVTSTSAKEWLEDFLKDKLDLFGPYEDAVTTKGGILFHSVLSPLLNIGLLTPQYVIDQTLAYAETNHVTLSSLEGFIRQIIGWREYIGAIYIYKGTEIRNSNYFGATRSIPSIFWTGDTGILPIDDTIKTALQLAYNHHIPRLMIMGNFMNLCGFEPSAVYKWFMEMYIDAYDWVMVPNVYSMTLYADGGLVTTKPYISGSSYILKMSDYPKSDWAIIWDALFWNFVGVHYELLSKEGRLGFVGVTYSKMGADKKLLNKKTANEYLKNLDIANLTD